MIQEIALTQLDLTDLWNDTIVSINGEAVGKTYSQLLQDRQYSFGVVDTSFAIPKACIVRISPSPFIVVASHNGTPYDVPCSDYSIFSLLGWRRHPDHRPK